MLDTVEYDRTDSDLTCIGLASCLSRDYTCQQVHVCLCRSRDLTHRYAKSLEGNRSRSTRLRNTLLALESLDSILCDFSVISCNIRIEKTTLL